MRKFVESANCVNKMVCRACRGDSSFRSHVMGMFAWDGVCPNGFTAETAPEAPVYIPPPMPPRDLSMAPPMKGQLPTQPRVDLGAVVVRVADQMAANKVSVASRDVLDARVAVCKDCTFLRGYSCQKCGCGLGKKIAEAGSACPAGKW
jgi:hypothetical protein